jgi:hypothetical protein
MIDLSEIIRLETKTGYTVVATAGPEGSPHVASARRLEAAPGGRLRVAEWFCPGTMANLAHNRRLSLVVWDSVADAGYQVLGEVEDIRDLSVLDGFMPGEAQMPSIPQIERELIVHVDQILDFRQAPHTDEPVFEKSD